jgi:hypothetical protein
VDTYKHCGLLSEVMRQVEDGTLRTNYDKVLRERDFYETLRELEYTNPAHYHIPAGNTAH